MWRDGSRTLYRRYREGDVAIEAYAEDFACLVWGLLELFQADGDPAWLHWALELQRRQDELFWDEGAGGWYSTTGADPSVILRMKYDYDGAEPSSVSVANLTVLAHLTGDATWRARVERTFQGSAARINGAGRSVPMLLAGLSAWHAGVQQVVIVGSAGDASREALERTAAARYLPLPSVRMLKIKEHISETPSTRTIRFYDFLDAVPGQFVMVWVPGVDEFPMSVSFSGNSFGITYQIVGEGTRALAEKKPGERVGIRGPYGRGFSLSGRRWMFVAGGLGMAPIAPLVDQAASRGCSIDLVLGARTASELLFERRVARAGATVHISTDDGSKGYKGFASDLADAVAGKWKLNHFYSCGPEKMIVKVMDLAWRKKIPMQASLERIMKCGIGVCDSCALDGRHVCRDGPVFSLKDLRSFEELGRTKLDQAGRKVPV